MDAKTLQAIGHALQSPTFRKSFDMNPVAALTQKGIDAKKVDGKVLDMLADLSADELKAIGKLSKNLNRLGIKDAFADVFGGILF